MLIRFKIDQDFLVHFMERFSSPYVAVIDCGECWRRVTDEPQVASDGGRVFSFNMTALIDHLEQQSTLHRLASYFNIDTLKYRVRHSAAHR